MKNINLDGVEYKVIKTLKTEEKIYYYTIDENNDNEVVMLCKNLIDKDSPLEKVEEREYPILMNKFALK